MRDLSLSLAIEPTKLLYVTTLPLWQWWFLKGQSAFMAARGFELHSITSPDLYFENLKSRSELTVHGIPMARGFSVYKDIVAFVKLYHAMKLIKPLIVQVSTPKAALIGSVAAFLARIPIRIYLMTGLHSSAKTGLKRHLYQWLEGIAPRQCTVTRCDSPSLLRYAEDQKVVFKGKGIVVAHGMSNGVDVGHFDPERVSRKYDLAALRVGLGLPPESPVVGFCGRLTKDKETRELLEAWSRIKSAVPLARLLLVGWWWEEVDLVDKDVRRSLEQDPRVHITGRVEDTAPYYALMTLLVHPSYREGFPNAPMEAAAMGLSVATTDAVGCVDAVLDGVTGTIVPVREAGALADAILRSLNDSELRRKHGQAGQLRVKAHFRQEIVWQAIYEFYQSLLTSNGLGVPSESTGALGSSTVEGQ